MSHQSSGSNRWKNIIRNRAKNCICLGKSSLLTQLHLNKTLAQQLNRYQKLMTLGHNSLICIMEESIVGMRNIMIMRNFESRYKCNKPQQHIHIYESTKNSRGSENFDTLCFTYLQLNHNFTKLHHYHF